MSFFKSFLISLISLLILNSVLMVIAYAIGYGFDTLVTTISANPMFLLYMFFGSMGHSIWTVARQINYGISIADVSIWTLNFVYIIAPLISAIIVGRMSKKRISSFLGVFATAVIHLVISVILVYSAFFFQIILGTEFDLNAALLNVILGSIANGVIYGLIAFLTTKK